MFYWFLKWIATRPAAAAGLPPAGLGRRRTSPTRVRRSSPATTCRTPTGCSCRSRSRAGSPSWPRRSTSPRPGIKGWFQKTFFSGAGQVPIDRSGASAAEGALTSAKRILAEGELFGIYPEGTRSHDGKLYRGKTGVARLALETGVPVIPVAVVGTDVVAPPGQDVRLVHPPDRALRQAAGLLAATRAWRTTATSCARSPTRSCTRSCSSPARSTSTCTPAAPRRSPSAVEREAGSRRAEPGRARRRRPDSRRPALVARGRRRSPSQDQMFRALAVLRVAACWSTRSRSTSTAATTSTTRAAGMVLVAVMVAWTGFAIWAYADRAGGVRRCWSPTSPIAVLTIAAHARASRATASTPPCPASG